MLDKGRADRAIRFIELLKHTKGWVGVPFKLLPWQKQIVRELTGRLNRDGTRQYRYAYLSMGRKNGKTQLAAALALYLLLADGEPGAEVYSAATDREQAGLIFRMAAEMVRQNPTLSSACRIVDSQKTIAVPQTGGLYRALSAEAASKHGYNPSAVIYDELHAAPNRDLWDVLTTGSGTRRQPLVIAITTAGYDRNSICWEQYEYAKKVLAGVVPDPTFYAKIFEVPEGADWRDESLWPLANPGIDAFRSRDEMRSLADKAEEIPALQNTFRRLYLNQWTSASERWIDLSAWDATAGLLNEHELVGQKCYGGLDLATTTDIAALVLAFPVDDKLRVLCRFWVPEDSMRERSRRDRVPYDVWAREGFITPTPGNVIDYGMIRRDINDLGDKYRIAEIGHDPWNATQVCLELADDGFTMIPIRQGFASLTAPSKAFETMILSKQIVHGGNPVLRWMVDNCVVRQDPAGNLKPDKAKSSERIDGVVAAVMAIDRATRHEQPVRMESFVV